ncbi:MAG: hypothetical protein EOO00_15280 [Chitinophagaceae bacterium]|nr:MAG: hypothetical protein EOO00_15280 [Chitinophagaceae bacterium]
MKHKDKQFAGIWIDGHQGIIITNNDSDDYTLAEKITLTDSQSGGSEHAINNGKKTEQLKYFKQLSQHLLPFDEILIFGPGQAQEQLQHHLKEDAQFNNKKISIDSAERLSDPQMIAKVRDFFQGR